MKTKTTDKFVYKKLKRFVDILFSTIALLLLALPMCVIALVIRSNSHGSVLFRQERSGLNKRPFVVYKFRTMFLHAPSSVATCELENPDTFITPIGKFLRRTSLDELPQLFNVFIGNMSLVGPRPVILQEQELIRERDKYNANSMLPGMTGWSQINGRDFVRVKDKAKMDGYYVEHCSMLLDAKILMLTFIKVFTREGVKEGRLEQKDKEQAKEKEPRAPKEDGEPILF